MNIIKSKGGDNILRIFLDLEATQFSKEIISIGAISNDNDNEFYSLIRSKKKITKLIEEITGLKNEDFKNVDKFEKVFDRFWNWCIKQRKNKKETILFYTYGTFDKDLFEAEHNRRPKDGRITYICNHIVDFQNILMMNMYGDVHDCLSLLNATKLFTNNDSLTQDHNALNDAKLLKTLYKNIGQPNINNLLLAEQNKRLKKIKKMFKNHNLNNPRLDDYLKHKESLDNLTFDEIEKFEDNSIFRMIEKNATYNYWLLSEKKYSIVNIQSINRKEG